MRGKPNSDSLKAPLRRTASDACRQYIRSTIRAWSARLNKGGNRAPKVDVSLKDFFASGQFGPVRLGISREELIGFLGKPDDYGCPSASLMKAGLWCYGDMEFHFADDRKLSLIWRDNLPMPGESSERIDLDEWIFSDRHLPTKEELITALQDEGIKFTFFPLGGEPSGGLAITDHGFTEEMQDGEIVLESGVHFGIGRVVEHLNDNAGTRTVAEDVVLFIGLSDRGVLR